MRLQELQGFVLLAGGDQEARQIGDHLQQGRLIHGPADRCIPLQQRQLLAQGSDAARMGLRVGGGEAEELRDGKSVGSHCVHLKCPSQRALINPACAHFQAQL
ncbi:MAG: hypothetical protein CFE41_02445 [Burkholderiales bacterium PBB2]|nr:MAG: hypothetical protein CFE41_02445 [Burkholderiales bacterium PBB2]